MKKVISLLIAMIFAFTLVSNCFAQGTQSGDRQQSISKKVQELLKTGLSSEDAQYYAEVDQMVKDMEANGEQYILEDNTPDLSDEDVVKNIKNFREKVLKKDKVALKKALKSTLLLTSKKYQNYITKLMEQNAGRPEYQIQLPDGSTISVKVGSEPIQNQDNMVHPSAVYKESYAAELPVIQTNGYYYRYVEWKYGGSLSYVYNKVRAGFSITLDKVPNDRTGKVIIDYVQGAQASAGVLEVGSYSASITRAQNNQQYQLVAEAQNSVLVKASGSFSASCGILSVSINTSQSFTTYTILRIGGGGHQYAYYAQYA